MNDWVLTLPQTCEWSEYEKELKAVENGSQVLNYRLPYEPKTEVGEKCYITWRGKIRGWMRIVGKIYRPEGFTCSTTGDFWKPGWYLQRSGRFVAVDGPEMPGFRGLRKCTRYCFQCVSCETEFEGNAEYHPTAKFLEFAPCPMCKRTDGVVLI